MARAVIERIDPVQRRDGACLYELWELDARGFKHALRGSMSVRFRRGNPDSAEARHAKGELHGLARAANLEVVRETA
jgi:hypothetical protein